jgi:two-component system sensor histidine kinase KdpD
MNWKSHLSIVGKVLAIMGLATGLAFALEEFGFRAENILLIYVGAVILIDIETKSLTAGLISAMLSAAVFNFLFTDPKFTFIVSDVNYLLSMIVFIFVAIVVNALILRLQLQIRLSQESETRVKALYQLSKSLMNQHTPQSIIDAVAFAIQTSLHCRCGFLLRWNNRTEMRSTDFAFRLDDINDKLNWLQQGDMPFRLDEDLFSETDRYVFPFRIRSLHEASAFLFIERTNAAFLAKERELLDGAIANMFIAFDRESFSEAREKASIQVEKEKFRTSLLRSITHDIKTPLTTLNAGTSLLIDSFDRVSKVEFQSMLSDINDEAAFLSEFVDNILNMTRIESNRLGLARRVEVVDDLLEEVIKRTARRLGKHQLHVIPSDEVLMVDADSTLLIQVLVNLVDNAVKHTREDCTIWLKVFYSNNQCCIEVSDDGGGIPTEILPKLFDDYTFEKTAKADRSRGTGLGLIICKAIVEAHGGQIRVWNNDMGGATFQTLIPFRQKGE